VAAWWGHVGVVAAQHYHQVGEGPLSQDHPHFPTQLFPIQTWRQKEGSFPNTGIQFKTLTDPMASLIDAADIL